MTREEAARAFAKKMGWTLHHDGDWRVRFSGAGKPCDLGIFPAPDAALPEALAFVGRVAEAMGADPALYRQKFESDGEVVNGWCVFFEIGDQIEGEALDLSHAALLAALAALEAR